MYASFGCVYKVWLSHARIRDCVHRSWNYNPYKRSEYRRSFVTPPTPGLFLFCVIPAMLYAGSGEELDASAPSRGGIHAQTLVHS